MQKIIRPYHLISITALLAIIAFAFGQGAFAQDQQSKKLDPPSDEQSDNEAGDSVVDGNPTFVEQLRADLDEDLDASRGSNLPILSNQKITVSSDAKDIVQIKLSDEAALASTGVRRGSAEVIYDSDYNLQLEVAAVESQGTRFITVINDSSAPTVFTYPLEIPDRIRVDPNEDTGSAVLIATNEAGTDDVVGYIERPWAYDANGNPVSVSQVITGTSIVLTIQHQGATYPVYADPAYYSISCKYSYSKYTSARGYLRVNGRCPLSTFNDVRGFWPLGTTHEMPAYQHRAVERYGECNIISDTDWYYDFQTPCKGHDYCYELIRAGYPKVSKTDCDNLFHEDMEIHCNHRWKGWHVRYIRSSCLTLASVAYNAVVIGGNP